MDTRSLQTFLKVYDLRSFTKAAQELGYVQSTVTAQIRQLEQELGYPLFDRLGKHIYVTVLGEQFVSYAQQIMRLSQQAKFLGKEPENMHGTLRVGVLESLLFSVLTNVLPQYNQSFPNVEVQVKMGRASDLLLWLKENKVDLVYYSHDQNRDPELCCCYSRREQLTFVAGPDHPLCREKQVSLQTLLQQPLIVTERSGICYQRLRALAAERGLTLQDTVEVDNTRAISEMVAQGMGCAFLPEYSVSRDVRHGTLRVIPVEIPPQTYYSQIVYRKDKWAAPYMQALIEKIRQARPEERNL